jgi:hypothetical protein
LPGTLPDVGSATITKYTKADDLVGPDRGGELPPVIDHTYPLEDVIEATRAIEIEEKTGNVSLTVTPTSAGGGDPGSRGRR